jgi:hypothetical protein
MRCNECGYTNSDNGRICGKCKAPISGGGNANNAVPVVGNIDSGKSTRKGANVNMPYWDDASVGQNLQQQSPINADDNSAKNYKNCPNSSCGYILMPDATDCPNCDWTIAATSPSVSSPPEGVKKDIPPPIVQKQQYGANPAKATMKLGSFNPMESTQKFSLTDNNTHQKNIFEGDVVEVNRANLDAKNMAISSKVHARFIYENGIWYITDESSNQATFMQVTHKMPLENGATLIMGNKILKFESE